MLFIIITDGEENASREFSAEQVKTQIERQKNKYGWEFIFLGANIDAVETAKRFGIAPDRAQSYHSDSTDTELNYRVVSEAVASFRKCAAMPPNWSEDIADDFKQRGSNSNN